MREQECLDVIERIGIPAALEQCTEECLELGQACIKMARFLRKENPTPMTEKKIKDHIFDEVADVLNCLDVIHASGYFDWDEVLKHADKKAERWKERLKEREDNNV